MGDFIIQLRKFLPNLINNGKYSNILQTLFPELELTFKTTGVGNIDAINAIRTATNSQTVYNFYLRLAQTAMIANMFDLSAEFFGQMEKAMTPESLENNITALFYLSCHGTVLMYQEADGKSSKKGTSKEFFDKWAKYTELHLSLIHI